MEAEGERKSKRKPGQRRPFPKYALEEALKVATGIQEKNAGKPWKPVYVAEALGISPTSTNFRYITSASYNYGLTDGTWNARHISLTPLGNSLTKPVDPKQELKDLQKAVLNVEVFERIYEHYRDSRFPEPEDTYFRNMLETDFGIPHEHVDECIALLLGNGRFTNIIHDVQGKPYVLFAEELPKPEERELPKPEERELPKPEEELEEEKVGVKVEEVPVEPPKAEIPRVFISHSKNKKIVDQIKQILEFGQFEYRIAEERETTAIPIPEKVFGLMRECNCAITNVSADEQEKRDDGTYGINQNVLIEIGAAFLLYNRKVILLVDRRIDLPSNLQGLYRCEYEGDELSFSTAIRLQKALSEFRKL